LIEILNGDYNSTVVLSFLYSIPDEAVKGNIFAIVFFFILLYAAIYLIQKLTTLLVFVLKKVFLLIIVTLAFYEFMGMFTQKLSLEGFSTETIIFGTAGFVIGVVAFSIALYVALHSIIVLQKAKKEALQGIPETAVGPVKVGAEYAEQPEISYTGALSEEGRGPEEREKPEIRVPIEAEPEKVVGPGKPRAEHGPEEKPTPISSRIQDELSVSALKNDKRIGAVIAYIIIAEFGVFSSKTSAAPSIETGLAFFAVFLLASLIFIKLTYHDYWRGVRHMAVAILIGGFLSILLGFFWGGIPLEQLVSLQYFASDALVALVTGLALSLFMGSVG